MQGVGNRPRLVDAGGEKRARMVDAGTGNRPRLVDAAFFLTFFCQNICIIQFFFVSLQPILCACAYTCERATRIYV